MNSVCCSKKGFKPSKFSACRKGWRREPISQCGMRIRTPVKRRTPVRRLSRKRWGSPVKPAVTRRSVTPKKMSRKKWGSPVKPAVTRKRRVLPKTPVRKRKTWSKAPAVKKVRKIRKLPKIPTAQRKKKQVKKN